MSLVTDAAIWWSLIAIFGAMFDAQTSKAKLLFLKEVPPFVEG